MACRTCGYDGDEFHDDPIDCVDHLKAQIAEIREVTTCTIAESLPAYVRNLEGYRDRLERELAEAKERIAFRTALLNSGHIITTEQIDRAWEKLMLGNKASDMAIGYEQALMDLGIVACPRCGGTKETTEGFAVGRAGTCDCPNKGWVIEDDDD